jgi:hypothetical protein
MDFRQRAEGGGRGSMPLCIVMVAAEFTAAAIIRGQPFAAFSGVRSGSVWGLRMASLAIS